MGLIELTTRTRYLFAGLSHLMEHMLITSARHVRKANEFGVKKILRNVLALQQGVKSLTMDKHDAEFEHAKAYFVLFFISPQVSSNDSSACWILNLARRCLMVFGKCKYSRLTNIRQC